MTSLDANDAQRAVRGWLEDIAGHRLPAESMKAMLLRIARTAGLDAGRVKKLWYGETENILWHEAETIRLRALTIAERRAEINERREAINATRRDLERINEHANESLRRRLAGRGDVPLGEGAGLDGRNTGRRG